MRAGRFREDLLSRVNLWTFRLPSLAERRERFLGFATSDEARWPGNFRDFNSALVHMATLAPAGRIDLATVEEELERLRAVWRAPAIGGGRDEARLEELLGPAIAELDRFDAVQLLDVVAARRQARSLSEAGRALYAASLRRKGSVNDADRLRKYLARHGLDFDQLRATR